MKFQDALLPSIVSGFDPSVPSEPIRSLFLARLGARFADIETGFRELYGARPDYKIWLSRLCSRMALAAASRHPDFAELDTMREADPEWFLSERHVATMMYVDRFAGSLASLPDRIPYLSELGITYVHLMPLLRARSGENDGGYAVEDYRDVDGRFGSLADLVKVARTLRERNMLLCLDVVLNHSADTHVWAQKALSGDKRYQDFYYMYEDLQIPDQFEKTMPEVFPDLAPGNFTWRPEINRWVMTVFNTYQWDLNYTNPEVFVEMLDVILNLANLGVDVLRLDATPFLWKRIGTSSQNEPEAHIILQTMKACLRTVAPASIFKSEAIVQPVEIIRYLGDARTRECDLAYNASLMVYLWDALATRNTRLLVKGLEGVPPIPEGTGWITYVRCHDDIGLGFSDTDAHSVGYTPELHRRFLIDYYTGRFPGSPARGYPFMENPKTGDARISGSCASLCGIETAIESGNPVDLELALRRMELLYGVVFSFGGIPLIYAGDELARCNDYSYKNIPELADDNRWMHRPVMDWNAIPERSDVITPAGRISSTLRRYSVLRANSPEFAGRYPYRVLRTEDERIFSFIRASGDVKTLILANFSETEVRIDMGVATRAGLQFPVTDRLTGREPLILEGKIRIPALGILWITDSRNETVSFIST